MLHHLVFFFPFPFVPCCILVTTETSPLEHFLLLPSLHRHCYRRSNILLLPLQARNSAFASRCEASSLQKSRRMLAFHNLLPPIPRPYCPLYIELASDIMLAPRFRWTFPDAQGHIYAPLVAHPGDATEQLFCCSASGIACKTCNTRHVRFTVSPRERAAFRTLFAVHVYLAAACLPFLSPAIQSVQPAVPGRSFLFP